MSPVALERPTQSKKKKTLSPIHPLPIFRYSTSVTPFPPVLPFSAFTSTHLILSSDAPSLPLSMAEKTLLTFFDGLLRILSHATNFKGEKNLRSCSLISARSTSQAFYSAPRAPLSPGRGRTPDTADLGASEDTRLRRSVRS